MSKNGRVMAKARVGKDRGAMTNNDDARTTSEEGDSEEDVTTSEVKDGRAKVSNGRAMADVGIFEVVRPIPVTSSEAQCCESWP